MLTLYNILKMEAFGFLVVAFMLSRSIDYSFVFMVLVFRAAMCKFRIYPCPVWFPLYGFKSGQKTIACQEDSSCGYKPVSKCITIECIYPA